MRSAMVQMPMPCVFTEFFQGRHAGHGSVFVHDFADDPGRFQAGQPCQIDRAFGLAGADHDPAFSGAQGKI